MQFTFCPYCGHKLDGNSDFCPECGEKLNNQSSAAEISANAGEQTDDLFGGNAQNGGLDNFSALDDILDGEIEKKNESEKKHRLIRVLCIRGKYDEATALCNELIETEPEDLAAYIGFIRIESKNYTVFEGKAIDSAIDVARQIGGLNFNLSDYDAELALYFENRDKYFADKQATEQKVKEEAEQKAKEQKIKENFEIKGTVLKRYKKPNYKGKVVIPDGITVIGKNAFCDCQITGVIIPNSATSIDDLAFCGCDSLKTINIPNNVISIGGGAFLDCKYLVSVNMSGCIASIKREAFYGCNSLKSINIPNSVTSIGNDAFPDPDDCNTLKKVTYEGSSGEWKKIKGSKGVFCKVYCEGDCVTLNG